MRFAELEETSRALASTASRSAKVARLAETLRHAAPAEIEATVAFLAGALRQGRIGLGPMALRAAAAGARASTPSLAVADVDRALDRIAATTGAGSATARGALLADLLQRATPAEADYLMRVVLGEVRQGALEGLMEEAIASAARVSLADVRRAAMVTGDLLRVAGAVLADGSLGLARFRVELFHPVQPMLAQPADDLADALGRLKEAALEFKLDGARVQIHRLDDEVRVYSRQLHDVTPAVPELVEVVGALPVRELILDGEVIALRPDGAPHPFQVTMRRFGRRLDVPGMRRELPLTPFFFDLLRVDGDDLLDSPARDRFAALAKIAPVQAVPRIVTSDPVAAEAFFEQALERGHEGLMVKSPDAPYAAGRRGAGWLKVKPAHTLDLVVLAAEWGNGRRQGWLSNLHLGARDPSGGFHMVGKTFKGMSDEMLEWQTRRFQELTVAADGYTVHVRPEVVVEIAFNDVQESPHYASGVALRFARVKRYREDKRPDEADTIDAIRDILTGRVRKSRRT